MKNQSLSQDYITEYELKKLKNLDYLVNIFTTKKLTIKSAVSKLCDRTKFHNHSHLSAEEAVNFTLWISLLSLRCNLR